MATDVPTWFFSGLACCTFVLARGGNVDSGGTQGQMIGTGGADDESPVVVSGALSPTEFKFEHPNGRADALPWDSPLILEASRPLASIEHAIALPFRHRPNGRPPAKGLQRLSSACPGTSYVVKATNCPSCREYSTMRRAQSRVRGLPSRFSTWVPPFHCWNLGSFRKRDRWWQVMTPQTKPTGCGDLPCVEIRPGCRGSSGVAWQLDTSHATEAHVTFAVPDQEDFATYLQQIVDADIRLEVFAPSGAMAPELSEQRDRNAGTILLAQRTSHKVNDLMA